jgi:hypothetical protein
MADHCDDDFRSGLSAREHSKCSPHPVCHGARRPIFQVRSESKSNFSLAERRSSVCRSISALLALSGTYDELYSLVVFALWIFLTLSVVALIRLRRVEPTLSRPYSTWGYPWTAILFLVSGFAMTVNLWLDRPVRCSIGLGIILLGLPFYFHWRKTCDVSVTSSRLVRE